MGIGSHTHGELYMHSVIQKVRWGKVVTHMEGCSVTQKVRWGKIVTNGGL